MIVLVCFLWWMSYSESVWILCCVLERFDNFFFSVVVEKDVIFVYKIEIIIIKIEKIVVKLSKIKLWEKDLGMR